MPLQKRVSELPAVQSVAATDLLIVSSANATKRCTVQQIGAFFQANGVAGPPGPAGPAGPAGGGYTLPTATDSVLGGVTFGVTAGTACQGNDARLTDAREWSASTVSQADAEAGSSTSRFAFTPLRVFQAIAAWWAGSAAKTKLDGIASGATANATDAQLLSRANHTGTQLASTISDFTTAVIAAAPPTTNASLLTSGTLDAARLPGSVVLTADARLSDARQPLSHTHDDRYYTEGEVDTLLAGKQATGSYAASSHTHVAASITDFTTAVIAAAPPTTNASLLTSGTLPDARLSANIARTSDVSAAQSAAASDATAKANAAQAAAVQRANHTGSQAISTVSGLQAALDSKQAAGTYATLTDGKVPASQLPSYVDDVLEYANLAAFPLTGETGKIYVTLDANKTYRWSGSAYIEISASPGSTDAVAEGSTNLYYTNARAAAAAPVQSVAGRTGAVTLGVADVANAVGTSDSRLTDSREWSASTVSQADAEAGTSTSRFAFTPLRVFQAVAAWWAGSAAKTKLDGIQSGATANATDAQLRDRATHTGTQAISTVSGLQTALDGKASLSHAHTVGDITGFSAAAAAAAPVQSVNGQTGAVTIATYSLPNATTSTLGGVIVGTGLGVSSGTVSVTYGTTSGTACQGNDARLSDARTPTGAAGGDLTGTYPNPTIAAGAVVEADLANAVRNQIFHPFLLGGL